MLCVFVSFEAPINLAVEDRVLDEDLLGQKLARSVSKICCHNELSISLINGESSGPRVYSVSELVEFPKHWSLVKAGIIYHELARFESIPHV